MKPLQWVVTRHRIPVILAATGVATVLLMLLRPGVAHAMGVEEETAFVFNTFSFLVWGRPRHVDVRRLHHAGGRVRPHQERLHDLHEEHRPLLYRRACLLHHRLQTSCTSAWEETSPCLA